jgi:sugar (pentulose or hexulose) kinase
MSSCTVFVDFGASRIKSVLWSDDQQAITAVRECAAPSPTYGASGEVELDPSSYWQALENTAGELLKSYQNVNTLWLCTEMHGVLIGSAKDGLLLTPYISWRDGRANRVNPTGYSTYDQLSMEADSFLANSGMKLRLGLPFLTLAHLCRTHQLPSTFRLFTLADWLLWQGGERDPGIHSSLAAGTGFFDIHAQSWSHRLLEMAGLASHTVNFPRIVGAGESIGSIFLGGRTVRVFGGLGDLQAAAFGAGFPSAAKLMVNLGTGSQVLSAVTVIPPGIERRPAVSAGEFAAITHIPAGRALNVFAEFLDGCAIAGSGKPFFWERFATLEVADVLAASPDINLNVFEASWRYQQGGAISKIHEGYLTIDSFLANLAKSWLTQYATAMELIDPDRALDKFLISGGLSRRASFILPVLEELTGRKGVMTATITGEETLDGLLALFIWKTNAY